MNIKKVSVNQLEDALIVFDQYMVFYKQPSAPDKYRPYLHERLSNNEATVFVAYNSDNQPIGFVLNYHSFSSVSLGKILVLNDLFVIPSYRKQGVAKNLIERCIALAKEVGAIRVDLATAIDNVSAQVLYEKIGFIKDTDYFSYRLGIN